MNEEIAIRPASVNDVDEMVSIDVDACSLYVEAGLDADLGAQHPYSVAERACWTRCARQGHAFLAGLPNAPAVGLLVMDRIDGLPYLEQLSIRRTAMRQGLGRRLLRRAIEWAGREPLWLTTYAHVPWNRPFYERYGFDIVPDSACSPGMLKVLDEQRQALPAPEQRVAMRRLND